MIWALLLLAGIAAAPFVIEALRRPMKDATRKTAPGTFVELSQGVTHYQWSGPAEGPVLVCIHGLTTPSFVWQGLRPALEQQGFRVLTYDLYGRGYSDRPKGVQNPAFFLQQLNDLLASQQVRTDITVIGYSMGGAIATLFAADRPQDIKRLILLAPAGMRPVGTGLFKAAVQNAYLGRWVMLTLYPFILRKGLRAEAHLPSSVPGINALQHAELTRRGFVPAVHSSLLGMLSNDLAAEHMLLANQHIPVMAIWGAEDDVIPLAAKDQLAEWNPNAAQRVIPDAGHGLTYTHEREIDALLAPFLKPAT